MKGIGLRSLTRIVTPTHQQPYRVLASLQATRSSSGRLHSPAYALLPQREVAAQARQSQGDAAAPRGFPGSRLATRSRPFSTEPGQGLPGPLPAEATQEDNVYDGMPKILVFGGNGFVGTRVCEAALSTGLSVVSINRSGAPKHQEPWMSEVEWIQADVFDVARWRPQLQGTVGVISCLGGFGSNEFMFKICGESNATVFREAASAGVERAAFISVHDYRLPGFVGQGYFKGKKHAEEVLFETFPTTGVALRPGFIHGTRYVGGIGIPLGAIGWPLEKALSYVPTKNLANTPLVGLAAVPPVSVKAVGKAAATAATDSVVPPGVLDVWAIQKFEE